MKSNKLTKIFKILLVLSTMTMVHAMMPLSIKLLYSTEHIGNGSVSIEIQNISKDDIYVLKWNTPFEKQISANLFLVKHGTKTVTYTGRMVKRMPPTKHDYMLLKAGEVRSIEIKLPQYYNMLNIGEYSVSYIGQFKIKKRNDKKENIFNIESPSITLLVTSLEKKTQIASKEVANFNGCSADNITVLNTAHDEALRISLDAKNAIGLADASLYQERYTTWFGAPDATRQTKVNTSFINIYDDLDTKTIKFDCSCTESHIAHVNIYDTTYTINLCTSYWGLSATGRDSQAGTLVHEMSHFVSVAGTDDHVYGAVGAKQLAITTPNNAVDNADNYEYFAENVANLAMEDPFVNAQNVADIISDLPLQGSISIALEKDIFTFVAVSNGLYTFFTTGTLDTQGSLYSETHSSLVYNDDINVSSNLNFSISKYLVSGEKYYIKINAYQNNTGNYVFNSLFESDFDADGEIDSLDTDDDNDGVLDINDAFPLDASESIDSDNDGVGNNADLDDDNDGISDSDETANGMNPLDASDAQTDFDNDGFTNAIEISLGSDIRSNSSHPTWTPIIIDNIMIFIPSYK